MEHSVGSTHRKISRILLATDFSEAGKTSFEASVELCRCLGANLYILNVFEYASLTPSELGGQMLEIDTFYKEAECSMESLIQDARQRGIRCEGTIGNGIAHSAILEAIATEKADLAVIGTRAIHGFERLVFGSTAEAVLRKASCPVYTVGPQAGSLDWQVDRVHGTVLFATDFHHTTVESLADAVMFAQVMQLPLHCLHVLPRAAEDGTHKGVIPLIITEALQHITDRLPHDQAPPVCAVTYGSEISVAVVEYARQHNARLIVLGVQRASLAVSHIPAHIAYRIITEAPCPVMTVAYPTGEAAAVVTSSDPQTADMPGASLVAWPAGVLI